jgi:hypothetical protein
MKDASTSSPCPPYKQHKKVKEQALSSRLLCLPAIALFCVVHPSPGFYWQLPVDNCEQSRLRCFTCSAKFLSETCCGKNVKAAKSCHIFQHKRFSSLCHTLQGCTCSTPSRYNRSWSLLCACVQFHHSTLNCFGGGIDWKLRKSRVFLWSSYDRTWFSGPDTQEILRVFLDRY